jgi:uncharacterized membrane protein
VALIALALHTASAAAFGDNMWDDGYMFVRYAKSVLAHGVVSWNGIEPAYGLTSQLQLLVTLPFVVIAQNPFVAATAGSLAGACLFLISIPFLIGSAVPDADALVRRICVAASYACLALAAKSFSVLAVNGMDTMSSLAFLSLYLALTLRLAPRLASARTRWLVAVGVCGGLAPLARPDFLLSSAVVPLALALLSPGKEERKRAWILLGVTGGVLALTLLSLWAYYGTPLPLTFYVKSGPLYGPAIWKQFMFVPVLELVGFVDEYKLPVFASVALALVGWRAAFRRGPHAVVVGVVLCVVGWVAYWLTVLQIMGFNGRFYYPTVPILLVLTSIVIAFGFSECRGPDGSRTRAWAGVGVCGAFLAALFTPLASGTQQAAYIAVFQRHTVAAQWSADFRGFVDRTGEGGADADWPCIGVVTALPGGISLASTEVGVPSVVAPEARILDLAGLNSTEIALGRMTHAEAIVAAKIDLVYLPAEQAYPEMREAILSAPAFKADYEVFPRGIPGARAEVAALRSGAYAAQFRACMSLPRPGETAPPGAFYEPEYLLPVPYKLVTPAHPAPVK